MGGQSDVRFLRFGDEGGLTAGVQLCQGFRGGMSLTYLVQDMDERHVLLSIDMIQLDGDIVYLLQCLRTEEVRRVVVRFEHLLVLGCDDGCQLCQVTNHQQLYTAKGLVVVAESP